MPPAFTTESSKPDNQGQIPGQHEGMAATPESLPRLGGALNNIYEILLKFID